VDVRIGVTYTPKEIEVELGDDVDRDTLVKHVESALSGSSESAGERGVLWFTDRRGRQVGVPVDKVAYVEIGSPHDERRVGFGTH
jgi:hypothetical protein